MIVTPFIGRRGDVVCEIDGVLCLFERRHPAPPAGTPVEVMISHAPPYRYAEGYFDMPEAEKRNHPPTIPFLFVRVVTDDDVLVEHRGFECSGSMCRTMADLMPHSEAYLANRSGQSNAWLTPGRTPVIEAGNVNVRYGEPKNPLTPGEAYVSLADLRQHKNRIAGVPSLDFLDRGIVERLARRGTKGRRAPAVAGAEA